MDSSVEKAIAALETLPADRREELAAAVVAVAAAPARACSAAENQAIDEGVADAVAGRFVSADELAATFARYRNG